MSVKRKAEDEIHEIPSDEDSDDVQIQEKSIPIVNLDDDDDETADDNVQGTHSSVDAKHEQVELNPGATSPSPTKAQQADDGGTNKVQHAQANEDLLLSMKFRDQELFQLFKGSLTEYLKTTFQLKLDGQKVEVVHHIETASIQVMRMKTEPASGGSSPVKNAASSSEKAVAEEVDNGMFVIDLTPAKSVKGGPIIPSYKKVFQKVLDNTPKAQCTDSARKRPKPKQLCWNCDGDHGLRDCKEPRNFAKILKMKQEFQKKTDRYHVDLEQKFGHIAPGRISTELRQALGLGKRDLPLHVYRMRMFGYPPGWLEDAKITHSGLQLFDSNGTPVQDSDESEGEIENVKYDVRKIVSFPGFNVPMEKHVYDNAKFYGVPPRMEHQSREEMIRNLEGTLVKGYRRKKLRLTMSAQPESEQEVADMDLDNPDQDGPDESFQTLDSVGECDQYEGLAAEGQTNSQTSVVNEDPEDGELNDEEECAPPNELQNSQKCAKANGNDENLNDSVILVEEEVEVICLDATRTTSPSLEDLTKQQQELLKQLEDQSPRVQNDDSLLEDVLMAERLAEEEEERRKSPQISAKTAAGTIAVPMLPVVPAFVFSIPSVPLLPVAPPPPPPQQEDPSERPPEPECLNMDEIKMTKTPFVDDPASMGLKKMSLGTPILTAFSPFNKLPCGDAFSKGVSDVINFENLPNSTGKYERMKSLLTKVRDVITAHNGEPEEDSR